MKYYNILLISDLNKNANTGIVSYVKNFKLKKKIVFYKCLNFSLNLFLNNCLLLNILDTFYKSKQSNQYE